MTKEDLELYNLEREIFEKEWASFKEGDIDDKLERIFFKLLQIERRASK